MIATVTVTAPPLWQPGAEDFCDDCPCQVEHSSRHSAPYVDCAIAEGYRDCDAIMPASSCLVLVERARGEAA